MDFGAIRDQLVRQRADIIKHFDAAPEPNAPEEHDVAGRLARVNALQQRAIAAQTEMRWTQELKRIESALARIARGTYGCCALCDEEINERRLQVNPTIPLCIRCAQDEQRAM